jgi:mRNA-degrading endonuclease RelE of RelBE toxin-antitoxin system
LKPRNFEVIFTDQAQKDLEKLSPTDALRIAKDINRFLKSFPLPLGKTRTKKLTGYTPPLYRLRSGDYRAYYRIITPNKVVVLHIVSKKDSEKLLRRFKKGKE